MHASMHRRAFTLIELIIILALLLFLLALLVPAVQKVRESASRTQSHNQLKQVGIAVHVLHDEFKRLPPAFDKFGGVRFAAPVHIYLLPYVEQAALFQDFAKKAQGADDAAIPVFISPQDTSFTKRDGIQNYAANLRVFSDPARKVAYDKDLGKLDGDHPCTVGLVNGMPDGTANTIMFSTKYAQCGEGGSRYAAGPATKFAAFFGQNAASKKADASSAKATFQLNPGPKDCRISPLMAQSFTRIGIAVCMGDGSVRSVTAQLTPQTWNAAVHPADGMSLGDDWND